MARQSMATNSSAVTASAAALAALVRELRPAQVFHLAAQHHATQESGRQALPATHVTMRLYCTGCMDVKRVYINAVNLFRLDDDDHRPTKLTIVDEPCHGHGMWSVHVHVQDWSQVPDVINRMHVVYVRGVEVHLYDQNFV